LSRNAPHATSCTSNVPPSHPTLTPQRRAMARSAKSRAASPSASSITTSSTTKGLSVRVCSILRPSERAEYGWTRREGRRRVWDAFQFYNELEILALRLLELNATVDKFVLNEATRTHSNAPKPLHFATHAQMFAPFDDKIVHVIVDDLPPSPNSWVVENFQRDSIVRGLVDADDGDLVVIADVDEIPDPRVLSLLAQCDGYATPVYLYTRFFNFKVCKVGGGAEFDSSRGSLRSSGGTLRWC
jgi:hypothetical protein